MVTICYWSLRRNENTKDEIKLSQLQKAKRNRRNTSVYSDLIGKDLLDLVDEVGHSGWLLRSSIVMAILLLTLCVTVHAAVGLTTGLHALRVELGDHLLCSETGLVVVRAHEAHLLDILDVLGDTDVLCNLRSEVSVDLVKDGDGVGENILAGASLHVARHLLDECLPLNLGKDTAVKRARLVKVGRLESGEMRDGVPVGVTVDLSNVVRARLELRRAERGKVVRSCALVEHCSETVTLEVVHRVSDVAWRVDGQLQVVGSEAVTVRVWVREQARLQNRVGRRLETWHERGRQESDLLNLCKVVGDILVELQLAQLVQRELLPVPCLGQVEWVDLGGLKLFHASQLVLDGPARKLAVLDALKEILLVNIGAHPGGLVGREVLGALVAQNVNLAKLPCTFGVDELEGVTRVALHLGPTGRNTTGTEEVNELMDRLWVLAEPVPKVGGVVHVGQIVLRVALLRVDEVLELGWVTNKEDWRIIPNPVLMMREESEGLQSL